MQFSRSLRGFSAGVLIGVLVGSAGMAAAAIGYKGWLRFSDDFKEGYMAGFMDMANMARNLDVDGYVDKHYPRLPRVKPTEWRMTVDGLYKDPKNQDYTITSMLQLAAAELEKKYGKAVDPAVRMRGQAMMQLEAARQRAEAKAKAEGKELAPAAPTPPRIVVANPQKKAARKWCRCDGKDPKEERAERRAAAELAEKQPAAGEAPKPGAPAPAASAAPATPATPAAPGAAKPAATNGAKPAAPANVPKPAPAPEAEKK